MSKSSLQFRWSYDSMTFSEEHEPSRADALHRAKSERPDVKVLWTGVTDWSGYSGSCVVEVQEHAVPGFDFARFFDSKARWSLDTFGPGDRYAGVIAHIRKELEEIEKAPTDLVEWVDVIFLAMDGAWRSAGADGEDVVRAMLAKHDRNLRRAWPDWRTLEPGAVSQHLKTADEDCDATKTYESSVAESYADDEKASSGG